MADDDKIILKIEADRASVASTKKAMTDVGRSVTNLKSELSQVSGDKFRNVQREAERASKAVDDLAQKTERANNAMQKTSKGGALAGKVGGALSQAGGSIGGEAGGALTQVGSALETISQSGVKAGAALGVATIALAGIALAVDQFNKVVGEAQAALQARYDAERDVLKMIASGATVEDAKRRVNELQQVAKMEADILARRQADLDSAFKQLQEGIPIIGDLVARVAMLLGVFKPMEGEITKSKDAINRAEAEITLLNDALSEGKFKAAPLAQTVEEIAPAADRASQALADNNDAMKQQQQAADAARQAQENYSKAVNNAATALRDSLADIARNAKQARQDAQTKLRDDFKAQERKFADDRREAQIKAQEEELANARDFNRTLRDIKRDALRTEEDLIAQRDFLGLRNLARDTQRRIEDERQGFDDAAQERAIARAQEAQERQRAFQDERRERQIAYQQQLRDLAENTRRQQEQARIAYARQLEQAQAELRLAQQTGQARINILGDVAKAEIGILSQLRDAVSGGRPSPNITTNNRTSTQNNQFNITGNNPQAIGDEVLRVINGLGY